MIDNKKIKILIVEDEDIICNTYAEELRDDGFSVITAPNGRDGLDSALSEKPNLILLDILMPVMDGLAMMDKLRVAGPYGKDVPIILLTNLSAGEDKIIRAVAKNNPAYYLIKSDWDLKQVVQKIKERLNKS